IPDTLLCSAQLRLTPAAAPARVGVEHVARPQHDAGLLRLERPPHAAAGRQPVPMRLAVLAAEQAASAVLDAIAGRIADGGLGRLDDEVQLPPPPRAAGSLRP